MSSATSPVPAVSMPPPDVKSPATVPVVTVAPPASSAMPPSPVIAPDVKQRALEAGFSEAELTQMPPEAVERALVAFDRRASQIGKSLLSAPAPRSPMPGIPRPDPGAPGRVPTPATVPAPDAFEQRLSRLRETGHETELVETLREMRKGADPQRYDDTHLRYAIMAMGQSLVQLGDMLLTERASAALATMGPDFANVTPQAVKETFAAMNYGRQAQGLPPLPPEPAAIRRVACMLAGETLHAKVQDQVAQQERDGLGRFQSGGSGRAAIDDRNEEQRRLETVREQYRRMAGAPAP